MRSAEPSERAVPSQGAVPLAFSQVYEDHVWRVYGFLAYRLGDRDGAEDLTQATFERALRAWSRYDRRRASVSTWLLSIATNVLIDHHRRSRTTPVVEFADSALPAQAGPEERLSGSPELQSAIQQLGEREREVLALRFGADLTGAEVATVLGLSLANVQQISSRALRRLRTLLEQPQPAPP